MRLYTELAEWWPLLSPASEYGGEAEHLLPLLGPQDGKRLSLLELGSGGGSLAHHLKDHFQMTLTDVSPGMLAVSRTINPRAEHVAGDMRTLTLGRQFDRVLIHDAIMYMLTVEDLAAALATAARHCRRGGRLVVLPDCVAETFEPDTDHGGHEAPDGRGLRYLEWSWDPDPSDTVFDVAHAFLLRDADGRTRVELDHQKEGVFARSTWLRLMEEAGFSVSVEEDPWRKDVFVGDRRKDD